jgi:ABC-2 type transport system ATP-binding protein
MTILLSTHYMREAEQLCDEVVFLRGGRILARGDPGSLKREILTGDRIRLTVDDVVPHDLTGLPGVLAVTAKGRDLECVVDHAGKRLPEILRHLTELGVAVSDVSVAEPTLESVFIELAR